jgi:DNA-binding transcriptional LysR family regulator
MLLLLAAVRDGLGMSCLPRYLCDKKPALIRAFNVPEEHCADLWILATRIMATMRVCVPLPTSC